MLEQIIFYVFAALLVLSAVMVITLRNPVHAALFLVLAFFCSAAIWLLLQAEFLAIALILVYVGAVMVLFLFVMMLLDINLAPLREGFARFLPVGIIVAGLMLLAMGLVVGTDDVVLSNINISTTAQTDSGISNTRALGQLLFTDYLYPFEIAGAVLMVAIIAAISLTRVKPRQRRGPRPEHQVTARPERRVRLVTMDAERRE